MRKATDEQIQQLQNLCPQYRNVFLESTPDVMEVYEANGRMKQTLKCLHGGIKLLWQDAWMTNLLCGKTCSVINN